MKIEALAVAVPKNKLDNSELEIKFGVKQTKRLSAFTGIRERHVATKDIKALELITNAAEAAILKTGNNRQFDAIFVITQTAEYKFPSTACIIQNKLNINKNTLAYDINLGCSGFTYGLVTSKVFLESKRFKRILLVVGDLTQSTASSEDSSTYPLFGDAFSAAILVASNKKDDEIISVDYGTDGSGANNLITYIGGSRYPNEEEYQKANGYSIHKEVKYPQFVYMNGTEIFKFSTDIVPNMVENLLINGECQMKDVDYFFFHQASGFIIKHLCEKLGIDKHKAPCTIEKYGNTSGASIPLSICSYFGKENSNKKVMVALLGFGVGYSWSGIIMKIDPSVILPVIEV
ncbi:ketoacyl-ACP synthase III [Vallitalea sediminicola]